MGMFVDLFGLVMIGVVVRQVLAGMPPAGSARVAHLLVGVLFLYGCIGFFGQAAAATGGLSFLPGSVEWPVLWPETTARDSSGNSIVGLASAGRIQVYDPRGRFLRGWFVDASGGVFKLQVTSSDQIEALTARAQRRFVFSLQGSLLEESTYAPAPYDAVITRPSAARSVRAAWPLWPLASPFIAWALFACGMIGLALSDSWVKRRRRRTSGCH
jgi:hypothetical protein